MFWKIVILYETRRVFGHLEPGQTSDNNVFGWVCYFYPRRPSAILTTEINWHIVFAINVLGLYQVLSIISG